MAVVPLSKTNDAGLTPKAPQDDSMNWTRAAAAGTLAAGALLLLSGQRRAGLLVAASGTALTMLDQKDTVRSWWNALPGYLEDVQGILGRVQSAVEDLSAQREKLHNILSK